MWQISLAEICWQKCKILTPTILCVPKLKKKVLIHFSSKLSFSLTKSSDIAEAFSKNFRSVHRVRLLEKDSSVYFKLSIFR
jgi:hypothetical protein